MGAYRPEAVIAYFDELGDGEWERLVKSPGEEIKLAIHVHYLRQYVGGGSRVLEIGAGPGRFTQMLAELDCRITVADLSPVQLDLNRKRAEELGFARCVERWVRADICDLSAFADGAFDSVIAYGGPLSYALDERERALAECVRVLRPGGWALLSVMSLWGTIHAFLPGVLAVPPESNRAIISTGDLTPENLPGNRHPSHMFTSGELRRFIIAAGLEPTVISASNSLSTVWKEPLDEIRANPERWTELIEMEIDASRQEGCLDAGTHIIAAARKPAGDGKSE